MDAATASQVHDEKKKKIVGLIFFRIVTITVLMGATTLLNYRSGHEWTLVQQIILYSIGATYFLSIFYLLAVKNSSNYNFQAVAQVTMDLLFWSCLIYLTGGLHSPFTILYTLPIFYSSSLLGKRGAYMAFVLSIIFFSIVILFEANVIFHSSLQLEKSFDDLLNIAEVYQFFLNFCMFFLVMILAVSLAKEVAIREEILTTERISLKMQKMLNRSIITGINSGFILIDLSGRITFFNMAAERISGYEHSEAIGKNLAEIFPPLQPYLEPELSGMEWDRKVEIRIDRDSRQHRWGAISFSDLLGAENLRMGSIVIIDEITQRRQLEERVIRSQKLAAVGELAAGIAHEIRNPLASISGSIQMLQTISTADDDDIKLMDIILRETDRLNNLITDFLSYARPNPLTLAPVHVREIFEDIIQLLGQDPKTGNVRIRIEYGENLPELWGDAGQFRQMFWNILKNSSEAASRKTLGVVWVTVLHGNNSNPDLPSIRFEISDNGPGMEREVLENIFDPFYTTKAGGTGLGMSIVYQVVQAHSGTIEVESEPDKGSHFVITLPVNPLKDRTSLN